MPKPCNDWIFIKMSGLMTSLGVMALAFLIASKSMAQDSMGIPSETATSTSPGLQKQICPPETHDSVAKQCAVGLFKNLKNLAYLPGHLYRAMGDSQNFFKECNANPEIKKGLLLMIEPLIRKNISAWMKRRCEQILPMVNNFERQALIDIGRKIKKLNSFEDMKSKAGANSKHAKLLEQQSLAFELTKAESEFLQRRSLADKLRSEIAKAEINRLYYCSDIREIAAFACQIIVTGGLAGSIAKGGAYLGARVSGRLASTFPPAGISEAAFQSMLTKGINPVQFHKIAAHMTAEEIAKVNGLLTKVEGGMPLNYDDAHLLGNLMQRSRVQGGNEILNPSQTSNSFDGPSTVQYSRENIYAFPFKRQTKRNSSNSPSDTTMISFQGNAANVFAQLGDIKNLVRISSSEASPGPVKNMVLRINNYSNSEGIIVVKEAELAPFIPRFHEGENTIELDVRDSPFMEEDTVRFYIDFRDTET